MLILQIVNELSNTIDVEQTLTKAEALFRRFQRTVEAVDRKTTGLAEPSTLRQRKPGTTRDSRKDTATLLKSPAEAQQEVNSAAEASGSGTIASTKKQGPTESTLSDGQDTTGKSKATPTTPAVKGKSRQWPTAAERAAAQPLPMKTISPELRALLNREVVKLDKKEVQKHGGGIGT